VLRLICPLGRGQTQAAVRSAD